MKVKIVLTITCIFSIIFIKAQSFNGGLIGGVSTSQVSGDRYSGFDKIGLYGGAFVSLPFNEKSAFQMEIAYIEKGSRKNPKPDRGDYALYKLKLNYAQTTMLYKYLYSKKFTLEAGLSFGILVKNKDNEEDESGIISGTTPFEKYDIGGDIGIYYSIIDNLQFNIRLSNTLLFFPVRPHAGGGKTWYNWGQYNTVLSFTIHYQF